MEGSFQMQLFAIQVEYNLITSKKESVMDMSTV